MVFGGVHQDGLVSVTPKVIVEPQAAMPADAVVDPVVDRGPAAPVRASRAT
jgi:hypothetical protein